MNQFLVSQLELNDPNWSSNTEVIQGSHGEITAVKITLVVKRRTRTGLARVLYDRVSHTFDAVEEATEKAFAQAASQFGIVAPQ